MEETTLKAARSPYGGHEAFVEQDSRAAHLYLRSLFHEQAPFRGCWVRNLQAAPDDYEIDEGPNPRPPLLPRSYCAYPEGQPPLDPDALSLLWFPTGDGVILLDREGMLATLPPGAEALGLGGFPGYARDCVGPSPPRVLRGDCQTPFEGAASCYAGHP